jgi:hypothetical protein
MRPFSYLRQLQNLLQLPQEQHLLLAVGQRPEFEQRAQHRLRELWVLLHKLTAIDRPRANSGNRRRHGDASCANTSNKWPIDRPSNQLVGRGASYTSQRLTDNFGLVLAPVSPTVHHFQYHLTTCSTLVQPLLTKGPPRTHSAHTIKRNEQIDRQTQKGAVRNTHICPTGHKAWQPSPVCLSVSVLMSTCVMQ